jgi:hypothetical protein
MGSFSRILILFITLWSFACGENPKIINPNGNRALGQPVINGYNNVKDSTVKVSISKVLPFNQPIPLEGEVISNAIVEISVDNGNRIRLPFLGKSYSLKIAMMAESIVELTVLIDAKSYVAKTRIPQSVQNVEYKYLGNNRFTLSWDGGKNLENYYEVHSVYNKFSQDISYSPVFPEEESFVSKDKRVTLEGQYYTFNPLLISENMEFEFVLYSLDSNLYHYQKDANNGAIFDNDQISSNPAYSNFKDAIGFFGCYQNTKFRTKIK